MKKAKWIISIFIFLLCMVLSSELYQNHLSSFSNQFFFFSIGEGDRARLYDTLSEAVDKRDMAAFAVDYHSENAFQSVLTIYANDTARAMLADDYYLSAGNRNSLFSGNTEVEYRDLSEAIDDNWERRIYFSGSKDDVSDLRGEIGASYATSYLHKENTTVNTWLIYTVWGLSLFFLLLMTWLDIQFQKKENFVLMSLGSSPIRLAIKNMVLDAAVFAGIFLAVRFLFGWYVYLDYGWTSVAVCFGIFLMLNAALYLSLLKYDYKEILYGANLNTQTLSNSYVLKAVTMIVAIASLSVNAGLIAENARYLKYYKDIERYQDYGTLSFTVSPSPSEEEYDQSMDSLWSSIYLRAYRDGKAAFSVAPGAYKDGQPVIVVSKRMEGVVSNAALLSDIEAVDFHVFAPAEVSVEKDTVDFAFQMGMRQFGLTENDSSYEIIPYTDDTEVLYFDLRKVGSDLALGFDKVKNPVFVYCTVREEKLDALLQELPYFGSTDRTANYLFQFQAEDITTIQNVEGVEACTYTPLMDICGQYKAQLMRIVLLNTVISAFLLLLEMVIVVTIIKLEYMIHAKVLALKKIFGYSIFNKNRIFFLLNFAAAGIAVVTMFIFSVMFGLTEIPMVLCAGAGLTAIETVFIVWHILKLERTSIPKILKGGSL